MLWRKSSEKGQGFEIFNRVKKAGFVEEGGEGVIQLGNSKCKCPEVGGLVSDLRKAASAPETE